MPRELFNSSLGEKKRSYAIDEKTSHRAAKFCEIWRGSERVSETHSSFGCYYRGKLSWSHDHLTDVKKKKKRILLTNWTSWKGIRSWAKMPYWTLLFKIILPSVLYELVVLGGCPNADLIHYLEVLRRRASQDNMQLAPWYAYWCSIPIFELEYFNLLFCFETLECLWLYFLISLNFQ